MLSQLLILNMKMSISASQPNRASLPRQKRLVK